MAIERQHTVEVSFDRPAEAKDLAALPAIDEARREGDKWLVTTADVDAAIRDLVRFAGARRIRILSMNTPAPTLDDAFLRLTEGKG